VRLFWTELIMLEGKAVAVPWLVDALVFLPRVEWPIARLLDERRGDHGCVVEVRPAFA
jgi:hypothetical protein